MRDDEGGGEGVRGDATTGFVFVVGGARSGKSRFAESLASEAPGKKLYVATAEALDAEMIARIEKHRKRRGPEWDTMEAPDDPASALKGIEGGEGRGGGEGYGAVLVDCLTLWLSNRLGAGLTDDEVLLDAKKLADACGAARALVVVVSNEVGLGIVPDNPLARRFTDLSGLVNQTFAARAGAVYFSAAGIPVRIK